MTPKNLDIIAEPGKTSFTTRRVVDAPRTLVFEAFTKPEHLKRWWAPQPSKPAVWALSLESRRAISRPMASYV